MSTRRSARQRPTSSRPRAPVNEFPDRDLPSPFIKYPTFRDSNRSRVPPPPAARHGRHKRMSTIDEEQRTKSRHRFVAWTMLAVLLAVFLGTVIHLKEDIESPLKTYGSKGIDWVGHKVEDGKEAWGRAAENLEEWSSEKFDPLREVYEGMWRKRSEEGIFDEEEFSEEKFGEGEFDEDELDADFWGEGEFSSGGDVDEGGLEPETVTVKRTLTVQSTVYKTLTASSTPTAQESL